MTWQSIFFEEVFVKRTACADDGYAGPVHAKASPGSRCQAAEAFLAMAAGPRMTVECGRHAHFGALRVELLK
jgi:hypothetical protein